MSEKTSKFAPEITWHTPLRDVGEDGYLIGIVNIGPFQFHAEAWEVKERNGEQTTRFENCDRILDYFVEGHAQTININRRDYVLAITPFQV